MVTIAQYMLCGMFVKPLASPSIRYMAAPTINTTMRTKVRNTMIFRALSRIAELSTSASPTKRTIFKTRNTRMRRSARITSSDCEPANTTLR